jgi:hypothetical protein
VFFDKSIYFLPGPLANAGGVRFGILNFGYWNLFEICDLDFASFDWHRPWEWIHMPGAYIKLPIVIQFIP